MSASPIFVSAKASSAVSPPFKRSAMVALDCAAFAPSSQTMGRASSAVFARHQVSATTATAPSFTLTTRRTPGRFATLAPS